MPYIITTRQTGIAEPGEKFQRGTPPRAVATLDEAREVAASAIRHKHAYADAEEPDYRPWLPDAAGLRESGGAIGPLPDGTVIVVKPVEWDALRKAAGLNPVYDGATLTIIDVFNAR